MFHSQNCNFEVSFHPVGNDIEPALAFLYQHEELCMFLISNLETFGPTETDHPNSGSFYCMKSLNPSSIIGIYSLCKSGILLIFTLKEYLTSSVIQELLAKSLNANWAIKGIIAEDVITDRILLEVLQFNLSLQKTVSVLGNQREVLMKISDLRKRVKNYSVEVSQNERISLLEDSDFFLWNELMSDFCRETNVPLNTEDVQRALFNDLTSKKYVWGYFISDVLVSIVRLNAVTRRAGSFGGVFTKADFRSRGIARKLIQFALAECASIFKHESNILFTGESNIPAIKLYESVGFSIIGYYKMCFFSS